MTRWRGGAVARWRGGAVARWRGGAVARWRDGAVARWRGGAVARASDCQLRESGFESCAAVPYPGPVLHFLLLQLTQLCE